MPLIQLTDICRTYLMGDNVVNALKNVNLTIEAGEFVAIVGPSGSGKSTLMYVLGCLDQPTSGSYRLNGQETATMSDGELSRIRNRGIGYVFQQYNLLPDLSVVDNIGLGMAYAGAPREHRSEQGSTLAGNLGLSERVAHTPRELSGGQMQRVAIARGLSCNPHLVLADEPTGNLDTKTGGEIMQIFKRLNAEGRTIVLVTHDINVANQANRIVRIVDGLIVSDERVREPEARAPLPSEAPKQEPKSDRVFGGHVLLPDILRSALHEGILAHKLRSFLTMLGIIFGIAAVIAMTAITEGGKQRQLQQIRQIGMNNIQVRSPDLTGPHLLRVRRINPDGVTLNDLGEIRKYITDVNSATAWKAIKAEIRLGQKVVDKATTLGVTGNFQAVSNFYVEHGRFLEARDEETFARVCVLGAEVASGLELDPKTAVGATVIVGDEPFQVVGVMGRKGFTESDIADVSIANRNHDVYIPYASLRAYFRKDERDSAVDAISLRMERDDDLLEQSIRIKRIVGGLHHDADDFLVSVPLENMRQVQRTKEIFNVIIIVIAAISLIVGGIGIMNIMLATVTERTREIGIRRAVGASKHDILRQFLAESLLISFFGGVLGLFLGLVSGLLIEAVFSFAISFNGWIMLLATATSVSIGVAFGIYPAWLAANKNPVDALRD